MGARLAARYPRLQVRHVVRVIFVQVVREGRVGRGGAASGAAVEPSPRDGV